MKQSTKIWIIVGIIIIVLIIIIVIYSNKNKVNPLASNPQNVDLSKLSPADLATYNSLPDDKARADFLGILLSQNKAQVINMSIANPDNINLSTLSSGDLATFYSLPNDAARADFLKLLASQGKASAVSASNSSGGNTTSSGTSPISSSGHQTDIFTKITDFFKGLFGKKKVVYAQTPPIDDQGYDIFGCNAAGFESDGTPCA